MLEPNNHEITSEPEAAEKPLFAKQAERLRQEVPIARVIGEYTKLQRTRKRLAGYCPLHEESKPTLSVDPPTNTFRCAGCGVSGDVIRFIQEVEHLTYGQALEALERIRYSDEYADAA